MRNFGRVLSNFAPQGIHPGYSAPSPIVPAGKHYTTPTVLSSGEALKKTNSVGVLSNFPSGSLRDAPVPCFPFYSRRFPLFSLPLPLQLPFPLRKSRQSGYSGRFSFGCFLFLFCILFSLCSLRALWLISFSCKFVRQLADSWLKYLGVPMARH